MSTRGRFPDDALCEVVFVMSKPLVDGRTERVWAPRLPAKLAYRLRDTTRLAMGVGYLEVRLLDA